MDPVVLGLGGVVFGFAGSLIVTRMKVASNERLAAQAKRQEREDRIRELGAQAYVSAVEAVQWLRTIHMEDSVDPKFEDANLLRLKYELREATSTMS